MGTSFRPAQSGRPAVGRAAAPRGGLARREIGKDGRAGKLLGLRIARPREILRALREAPELDVALALAAFVALLITPGLSGSGHHVETAAVALAGATALPLIVRRTYPLAVLALVLAGLLACLAVFHPDEAAVGVAMLAAYTVGLEGSRIRSLLVGAALAPVVAFAVAITSGDGFEPKATVARLAVVLAALAVGDARRGRQALSRQIAEEAEREREAAAVHRFDEERLRVAHELHDTVAHALVGINATAAAAAHLGRREHSENLDALREITRSSAGALAELRSTLKLLRPAAERAPLHPRQSLTDLPELLAGVRGAGLDVQLQLELDPASVAPAVAHGAYRIVQESLTNVLRHSRATRAGVRIVQEDGAVAIEVRDGGPPTAPAGASSGQGLLGMAERAAALGGRCEAGAAADGGFRVRARLPNGT